MLTIGELAEATGVSARAIRHYERQHLVASSRAANNYRLFERDAIARVNHIQHLIGAGFCTTKIAELLEAASGDETRLSISGELLDELVQAKRRLEQQRFDLDQSLARVDELISAATGAHSVAVDLPKPAVPARGALKGAAVPPSQTLRPKSG